MSGLDVAVVGAGPAGSTAARVLASAGARVSLFETRVLPRQKACAGALTPKAQRLAPASALAVARSRLHKVELRGGWLAPVSLAAIEAEVALVERSAFDMAMAEAAAVAGVDIHDGSRVDSILEDDDGVTLIARGRRYRADVVVAADGEPSSVARRVGLGCVARRRSLALETDVMLLSDTAPDTAILSLAVPRGYAWYFPKHDHASVGVVSARAASMTEVGALRTALDAFLADLGSGHRAGRVTGHWIPQALRSGDLASRRVLLVGDAAATADPLFGEGIAFALRSAMVASEVIADLVRGEIADLRPFDARLRATFRPPLRRLEFAAGVADRFPSVAMAAVRLSPWVRAYAVNTVAGQRHPFEMV